MIAIIDYGLGNVGSIANMLKVIGEKSVITYAHERIINADKVILPGVGAFDAGMEQLETRGLLSVLRDVASKGKPILGICLGMQLLGEKSEEGQKKGIGLLPFQSVRFCFENNIDLKIPHMGWDTVDIKKDVPLVAGITTTQRYYFVHSFHAVCANTKDILMTCDYGYEFAAAVCRGNIYGVQFHPEKSHDFGMQILNNFARRC